VRYGAIAVNAVNCGWVPRTVRLVMICLMWTRNSSWNRTESVTFTYYVLS